MKKDLIREGDPLAARKRLSELLNVVSAAEREIRELVSAHPGAFDHFSPCESGLKEDESTWRLTLDLRERVKELRTLYRVAESLRKPEASLPEVLAAVAGIIPGGFLRPGVTGATIFYDDRTYVSPGFREAGPELREKLMVRGVWRGEIRVVYGGEMAGAETSPFLKEEAALLKSLADLLCSYLTRVEAEASLMHSERNFRLLAESMPLMVWTAKPDGAVDFASRAMHHYTGLSPQADPGEHWQRVLHPDDLQPCLDVWGAAVAAEREYVTEFRIWRAADRTFRWHHVRAVPGRDPNGRVFKWFGTAIDIHDFKETERKAREMAARLTATLESIADGFLSLDREYRFTFLNAPAARMLAVDPKDSLGCSPDARIAPELARPLLDNASEALKGMSPVEFEVRLAEGGLAYAFRCYPYGQGVTVYLRDVTEKRALEDRLLRSQRMESLGTLAGGIAHDLNNLLTPVLMGTELLEESVSDDSLLPVIRQIENSARRGSSLVRQVLTFSRGTSGERRTLAVSDLVAEVEALVRTAFPKDISFLCRVHKGLELVGDPTQMNQVLVNLAVNARDAMPGGGTLELIAGRSHLSAEEAERYDGVAPGDYIRN